MEYIQLLNSWGLCDCVETFLEEGITDESFKLIDNETMNCLFKKRGPLLIFKKKFQEYVGKNSMTEAVSECSDGSTETLVSSDYQFEPDEEFLCMVNFQHEHQNQPLSEISESTFKVPKVPSPKTETIPKKIKLSDESLEDLLKSTADGRIILANKRKLSNEQRQKLAKIVVNDLVNRHMKNGKIDLRSDVFVKAAQQIITLFPTETVDTYYIPYSSPKTGLRQPARGKLWSRYVNLKAALRTAEAHSITQRSEKSSENIEFEYSEEVQNNLIYLKSAIEPYHKILNLWQETYSYRTELYRNKGLEDIYRDFACLKTQNGIELLESDFNQLYPDKTDIIYSEWPNISLAIIKEAKERNISLAADSDLDASICALLVLPLLFSPLTIKKSIKKNWRPTRLEIQESFFFRAQDLTSLHEVLERRKLKLQAFDVPLQPFATAVGDKNNIDTFFIVFNDVKYKCESSIRCLELLFKAIHALNLEYPVESKHIWLFIQEMVFKMPASKNSNTASVIADINYHLKSN